MRHHLDFINDVLCADAEGTADKALLRAYKCGEWRGCDGLEQIFYAMRFRDMPVGKFKQLVRDAENVNLNEPEIILVQFSGNGIIAVDGPAFLPSKAIPCATLIADGKLTPEARHHKGIRLTVEAKQRYAGWYDGYADPDLNADLTTA